MKTFIVMSIAPKLTFVQISEKYRTLATLDPFKKNSVDISQNGLFWSKIFQKSDMRLKSSLRQGFSIPNNRFLIGDL